MFVDEGLLVEVGEIHGLGLGKFWVNIGDLAAKEKSKWAYLDNISNFDVPSVLDLRPFIQVPFLSRGLLQRTSPLTQDQAMISRHHAVNESQIAFFMAATMVW